MRFTRMINAVDVIGGGLPGRVITGGVPDVPGKTMLDKAPGWGTVNCDIARGGMFYD